MTEHNEKPQDDLSNETHTDPSNKTEGSSERSHAPETPKKTNTAQTQKGPEGGFDDTPLLKQPPGYTVKITFHRATNLPLADINTLSADPFILAELKTDLPTRHKEDPPLQLRTRTIRQSTDPEWHTEWIIANVPASGFRLKCRIYDEDPADHDDRLGNVHVNVSNLSENWAAIRGQSYPIKKRMGSKRAYLLRAIAVCFGKVEHMSGSLFVSVEVLGKTPGDNGSRAYTDGPLFWIRHYSPLLGRLLGQKEPTEGGVSRRTGKPKPERYNFQANQMQLKGPVPEAMYHRYVEFKPFVKAMFTAKGVRGYILSKTLHHQHARVYNFDQKTEYEFLPEPCADFTKKFLELCHYDQGGRIFTYVLTLDALFRFTETGKEFGIDMLSKHTMHSDVAAYTAFSGEFFIRRLKHSHRGLPEEGANNPTHPPDEISGGPPKEEPKTDPSYYELIIDNDSGTYRPNCELLPQLKEFMEANFPGLRVLTLDSQGEAEKMAQMKKQQRDRKKTEGDHIVYKQMSRSSSMSSSDEEDLDRMEADGEMKPRHLRHHVMREAGARAGAAKAHLRDFRPTTNNEAWRKPGPSAKPDDAAATTQNKAAEQTQPSEATVPGSNEKTS
ncbi:C2 domain-containing protein [Aaosphaeria arxii CBS 175.79]|uniref:C2 domain-containing protein n=1 Tax=Aaosphaeria arxii CBS 175.79 TaxID=1450172 RepID=A0A6A5XRP5_9PLEO|nr:C2 domain-containing protein [Aaosphaeria arxii CBS 175.79]KAF2015958.1 C2 domain-containing protein [Aaosphaeria arxii CBS 175.79]